jgi:hypothetical protein
MPLGIMNRGLANGEYSMINDSAPNGWRYPLGVGGWIHRRNGKNSKPRKKPKNAPRTPSRVHALLGALSERRRTGSKINTKPILSTFYLQQSHSQGAKRFQPNRTLTKQTPDKAEKRTLPGNKNGTENYGWNDPNPLLLKLNAACQPG